MATTPSCSGVCTRSVYQDTYGKTRQPNPLPWPVLRIVMKCLIFPSSPANARRARAEQMRTWLKEVSPEEWVVWDRCFVCYVEGLFAATTLGAQAYEALGLDDEAEQLALLTLDAEKCNARKCSVRVDANLVLGRVATRRGDAEKTKGHFDSAGKLGQRGKLGLRRHSHSHTSLYISLVVFHIKYSGSCEHGE
jgi:hypothetical protein